MHPTVLDLQKRPQIQQRTPPWYNARRSLITASEAGSFLKRNFTVCQEYIKAYQHCDNFECILDGTTCNPYNSERELILLKKGKKSFGGSIATEFGTHFEPVATQIYENEFKTKIHEFGLLVHQEHDFLAASPDGCTSEGVLVEIKCPYRRQLGQYPLLLYWTQCQLQMEVCDIDTCDFLECDFIKIDEREYHETQLEPGQHKGIYVVMEDGKTMYPDAGMFRNYEAQEHWADSFQGDNKKVFWKLRRFQVLKINREKEWFTRILPLLQRGHRRMMNFDASNISDDTPFVPINPKDYSALIPRRLQPWEITTDLYSDDEE